MATQADFDDLNFNDSEDENNSGTEKIEDDGSERDNQNSSDDASPDDDDSGHQKSSNSAEIDTETNTGDETADVGLIYARVSSNSQKQHSIDTQINTLSNKADKQGITLPYDPIRDEGKTGGNFKRDGIKKVFKLATSGKITHLLVDDISRIGRNAPQTLYFMYTLNKEFDVTILTSQGEIDTEEYRDLLDATLNSLVSHISAKQRGRKALDTKIRRFIDEKNWHSWYNSTPIGYQERDDGWIEPDHQEIELAKQMFQSLIDGETYRSIKDRLNSRAQKQDLSTSISTGRVKRSLKNPVYIGKPTISSDSRDLEDDEAVVEDDDLQIIDVETFEKAQQELKNRRRDSSSSDEPMDVSDFVDTFGLLDVLENSAYVELICPDCDKPMVKNGNRDLINGAVHNYICKDCGLQRKFPKKKELDGMIDQLKSALKRFGYTVKDEN